MAIFQPEIEVMLTKWQVMFWCWNLAITSNAKLLSLACVVQMRRIWSERVGRGEVIWHPYFFHLKIQVISFRTSCWRQMFNETTISWEYEKGHIRIYQKSKRFGQNCNLYVQTPFTWNTFYESYHKFSIEKCTWKVSEHDFEA